MILLDEVVLRYELDPHHGQGDADQFARYAEILDELPQIEVIQGNELIDSWHLSLATERFESSLITYVVKTDGDDRLVDRLCEANWCRGVQYTRLWRKLHKLTRAIRVPTWNLYQIVQGSRFQWKAMRVRSGLKFEVKTGRVRYMKPAD